MAGFGANRRHGAGSITPAGQGRASSHGRNAAEELFVIVMISARRRVTDSRLTQSNPSGLTNPGSLIRAENCRLLRYDERAWSQCLRWLILVCRGFEAEL